MDNLGFEILLYGITTNVVNELIKQNNWTEDEALEKFVMSKLYSYLEKEETKVWHYSTLMLVELFNDECSGSLIFPEV